MHVSGRTFVRCNSRESPESLRVRAIKRDASAARLDPSVSMIVHGTLMYLNLTFMTLLFNITPSDVCTPYRFGATLLNRYLAIIEVPAEASACDDLWRHKNADIDITRSTLRTSVNESEILRCSLSNKI